MQNWMPFQSRWIQRAFWLSRLSQLVVMTSMCLLTIYCLLHPSNSHISSLEARATVLSCFTQYGPQNPRCACRMRWRYFLPAFGKIHNIFKKLSAATPQRNDLQIFLKGGISPLKFTLTTLLGCISPFHFRVHLGCISPFHLSSPSAKHIEEKEAPKDLCPLVQRSVVCWYPYDYYFYVSCYFFNTLSNYFQKEQLNKPAHPPTGILPFYSACSQ